MGYTPNGTSVQAGLTMEIDGPFAVPQDNPVPLTGLVVDLSVGTAVTLNVDTMTVDFNVDGTYYVALEYVGTDTVGSTYVSVGMNQSGTILCGGNGTSIGNQDPVTPDPGIPNQVTILALNSVMLIVEAGASISFTAQATGGSGSSNLRYFGLDVIRVN